MERKIIDISQTIRPEIPVWPGDTPFSIEETWTISDEVVEGVVTALER